MSRAAGTAAFRVEPPRSEVDAGKVCNRRNLAVRTPPHERWEPTAAIRTPRK
jgi:hypothetical protein